MSSRVTACPSCGTRNRVPVAAAGRPQCASCHKPLPWLVDAGDADFAAAVDTNQLVLVDLWAPWCGPCRMVAPILERLSVRYAGEVKVVKVNVDDNRMTATRFDASSIPTLIMMRDGQTAARLVGAQPEPVLRARIDALLAG
ncbi:MAG: thioredoxin [Actinobacteria bacterium]|nr:thioredoxin [Actinomycetota bacterium]